MLYWDWVLTLGIILFAFWFWMSFYKTFFHKENKKDSQYLIVLVQNNEEIIEDIIRKSLIIQRRMGEDTKLLIVDLGSTDKTLEIIKRMAYPEDYFAIFLFKDRQEFMDFVEEYKNKDCLVMEYFSETGHIFTNITDYKLTYHID